VDGKLQDGNPKEEMSSGVWCRIWDDFFVPSSLLISQNEKLQKEVYEPRLCRDELLSIETLEMLWQLRKPLSLADVARQKRRSNAPASRRASAPAAARRKC
jgi:hypothetical protein